MADYKIIDAKWGIAGAAMEPVVVAEAKLMDENGGLKYVSLAEIAGMPCIYLTDRSTFNEQMNETENEEFFDYLNAHDIYSENAADYEEIINDKTSEWFNVFRYLIFIVRSDADITDRFIEETKDKWISKIEIPASDIEEELS